MIVHAIDLIDLETLHHPVVDHDLTAGTAFFGRLEDHHRRAGEIAGLGEIAGRAKQHGGVAVMAARMHLAGHGRLIRQPRFLLDRQRVHVGAHSDHPIGRPLSAVDDADHAGTTNAGNHLVAAEFTQLLGRHPRRAADIEQQFRMGMQVMSPFCDFVLQVGDAIQDWHFSRAPRTANWWR